MSKWIVAADGTVVNADAVAYLDVIEGTMADGAAVWGVAAFFNLLDPDTGAPRSVPLAFTLTEGEAQAKINSFIDSNARDVTWRFEDGPHVWEPTSREDK